MNPSREELTMPILTEAQKCRARTRLSDTQRVPEYAITDGLIMKALAAGLLSASDLLAPYEPLSRS